MNSVNEQDKQFVAQSWMDHFSNLQILELAVQKASPGQSADFAQQLKEQHLQWKGILKNIASDLALKVTDSFDYSLTPYHNRLEGAYGREFDSVFVHGQRQILLQRKQLLENSVQTGNNSRIKNYGNGLLQYTDSNLYLVNELVLLY